MTGKTIEVNVEFDSEEIYPISKWYVKLNGESKLQLGDNIILKTTRLSNRLVVFDGDKRFKLLDFNLHGNVILTIRISMNTIRLLDYTINNFEYLEVDQDKLSFQNDLRFDLKFVINKRKKQYLFIDTEEFLFQYHFGKIVSRCYKYSELISYEIEIDNEVIIERSSSIIQTVGGGILFGGAGAIAGALSGGKKISQKNKKIFYLKLTVNDIKRPGVIFETNNYDTVFNLSQTLKHIDTQIVEEIK